MRLKARVLALVLLALAPSLAVAQKNCKKGKPCGNTCIAQNRTCRIGSATPTQSGEPASTTKPVPTATAGADKPWVAIARGRTYYLATCAGAKNLAPANRLYFKTEADAKAAGLTRSKQKGC